MTFSARGGVSIAELIVYIPALVLAFIICSRHGFTRASGWVYTLILCLVRIVGAICRLLTYSDHSTGLLKATLIIDSIGISPLLLATLGMLSRLVDWVNTRGTPTFTIKHFRVIQLLITIGLILSIAGGTGGSTNSNGQVEPATTSKVGIILYIIAFAAMAFILLISCSSLGAVPTQEKRISVAVMIAFPFILIRLAYSAISVFIHNKTFSVVGGSVGVFVAMAIFEEFIVVVDYLILGFRLNKLEEHQQGELANRAWKDRNQNRRRSRSNRSRSHNRDRREQQGPSYQQQAGYESVQVPLEQPHAPHYPEPYGSDERV